MLIEIFLVRYKFNVCHAVYSLSSEVIYMLYSLVLYLVEAMNAKGQNCIYDQMNWEHPIDALRSFFGVFSVCVLLHLFICAMCRIREKIFKFIYDDVRDEIVGRK